MRFGVFHAHQNEDIVRLAPAVAKRRMAEREAAAARAANGAA